MEKFDSHGLGGWHRLIAAWPAFLTAHLLRHRIFRPGLAREPPIRSVRCKKPTFGRCPMWWTGHRIGIFSLTETRRVTSETEMVDLVLARQFATPHGERAAEPKENGG